MCLRAPSEIEQLSLRWDGKVIEITNAAAKPSVPQASEHENSVLRQCIRRKRRAKFAPLDRQKHDRKLSYNPAINQM